MNIAKVEIDYTNWRGERRKRILLPMTLMWGVSQYHKGDQWLLLAMDCEDGRTKEFAMNQVHEWKQLEP